MSRWTHVRGTIKLKADAFEIDKSFNLKKPIKKDFKDIENFREAVQKYQAEKNRHSYFPFPKEQFKLIERDSNYFEANLYSLPRAVKYIEEAFKLLPLDEFNFVRHSIDQGDLDSSTSHYSDHKEIPCLVDIYKESVEELFNKSQQYRSTTMSSLKQFIDCHLININFRNYTFNELQKQYNIKDEWLVNYADEILVSISDDLRYCSAKDFKDGLLKFFKYLSDNRIYVLDGYIEWEDEYEPKKIYAWRKSGLYPFEQYMSFMILDSKTNEIVEEEKYFRKKDQNGNAYLSEEEFEFDIETIKKEK